MMNEGRSITSLQSLEQMLEEYGSYSFDAEQVYQPVWYRGVPDSTMMPIPAVQRDTFRETMDSRGFSLRPGSPDTDDAAEEITEEITEDITEDTRVEISLNKAFLQKGASLFGDYSDPVPVYFLAQHHRLPTRLLDWTENLLVALFFAVNDERYHDRDGCVYTLFPRTILQGSLDALYESTRDIVDMRHPHVVDAIDELFGFHPPSNRHHIIPIAPDWHSSRMIQQSACFTLHMPAKLDSHPLHKMKHVKLWSHFVPKEAKKRITSTLRRIGIHWSSLFPDLDHLSTELKSAFGLTGSQKEN